MNNKDNNLKEKLKQALSSTARVISDNLEIEDESSNRKNPKKFDLYEIENLSSKSDFIKARAESDSSALKQKFSDNKIYNKNPLIYAEEGIFNIIGYRFKCQLAENSKVLAFNNAIPEMNHNEIEAYTNDVNTNNNFIVIWIKDDSYNKRNLKRISIVSDIWKSKIKKQLYIQIESSSNNILKYLSYIHLLDWVSYHCAILNNIDPSIIPNINKLKKSL